MMGIHIPRRDCLFIETGPRWASGNQIRTYKILKPTNQHQVIPAPSDSQYNKSFKNSLEGISCKIIMIIIHENSPKPAYSEQLMAKFIRHQWVNTLRPRQNDRHFPDNIFKCTFLKFSLKFVPKVPIDNILALLQIMAWRQPGDKPLSESMVLSLLTHICVARPQWLNIIIPIWSETANIWNLKS